jgi:hypothetical protein
MIYGYVNVAQVVVEILVPTAGIAPPVITPAIKITFRGVKRIRCAPEGPEYANVPVAPSVKRAM